MSTREQKLFPARLTALPDAAAFAQAFCNNHGIAHDDAMRLTLIIEELFTNTIQHGYRAECDDPISIALSLDGGSVGVLYEDSAPRYDPLSRAPGPPPSISRPVDSRSIGGLGVYLVSQLVEGPSYVYEGGYNRLQLRLLFAIDGTE